MTPLSHFLGFSACIVLGFAITPWFFIGSAVAMIALLSKAAGLFRT